MTSNAVGIAQAEFDRDHPDVVVGSSRRGAVAMNINSCDMPRVLLCPAWKRWGTATTVKPGTIILHWPTDEVVPFAVVQHYCPALLSNLGAKNYTGVTTIRPTLGGFRLLFLRKHGSSVDVRRA